jgi:hypothetical protein
MNPDLLWFVRLGIEVGLFNRLEAVRICTRLGGNPTMIDFAQRMIDDDIVEDVAALEKMASTAAVKARSGPPPTDPFLPPSEQPAEPPPAPAPKPVKLAPVRPAEPPPPPSNFTGVASPPRSTSPRPRRNPSSRCPPSTRPTRRPRARR